MGPAAPEELSDEENLDQAGELEERAEDSRMRLKQAGAKILDQEFLKRLESEPAVSLHTVVSAARNRSAIVQREKSIEKRTLSRRQRAQAIMSGAQIDSCATSYTSHTESSAHSPAAVRKADWSKTAKWEPGQTGTRNFAKDPVQPRYLGPKRAAPAPASQAPAAGAGEAATGPKAHAPSTSQMPGQRVAAAKSPLKPLTRRMYEIESGGNGRNTDEVGIYRMPEDKHARARDGVHENRARYTGELRSIQSQGNLSPSRSSQQAGRQLGSKQDYAYAVRAVVHNGRSTATSLLQPQQSSSPGQFDRDLSPLQSYDSVGRPSPKHRRPTEQQIPIFTPETIGADALQQATMSGQALTRLRVSTTPSPTRSRRRPSPLHATAPVVLAEMARHQHFMRVKTPWTGGGFRRPRDQEDLTMLYGHLQGGGASPLSTEYPVVFGDQYVSPHAAPQLPFQADGSSEPPLQTADGIHPSGARRPPSRGMTWGALADSQAPWGEADDDTLRELRHGTEEMRSVSIGGSR